MMQNPYPNLSHTRPLLRLGLTSADDLDEPRWHAAENLMQQALRRGGGYGIAAPSWREGKNQRPAKRPQDVKVSARKLVKFLKNNAAGSPQLLGTAAALHRCDRRHRCLHPACPQCGRAVQRLFVRALVDFLDTHEDLGPWVMLSLVLPPLAPSGGIDFAAERARYTTVLRQAGLTLGAFGLDLSFNEDDRRRLPKKERFTPHPCVHLYGIAPVAQVAEALPVLKRFVPATVAVRRPVWREQFDGNPAALAYSHKPGFTRRQTIEQVRAGRVNLVRTTRDRPLRVEQRISAVRALTRAGLTGRIMLLGLRLEIEPVPRARPASRT